MNLSKFVPIKRYFISQRLIIQALLALANLYLGKGDFSNAQNQCSVMLKMDVGNEEATLMVSRILCQQKNFTFAMSHLRQLLDKEPIHWHALAMFIEVVRRAGVLDNGDAEKYLDCAVRALGGVGDLVSQSKGSKGSSDHLDVNSNPNVEGRATMHAGYHYCKGLFYRYYFLCF